MSDERNIVLQKVISLLQSHGFSVSSFMHTNTCFDLVAKRKGISLLIKVFDNVDSLRPEHADELEKLGEIFNSSVLIIGKKTKKFTLETSAIYNRYGISVLNIETFSDFLTGNMPSVSSFKGRDIVELDSEKLKKFREKKKIPMSEIALDIGTTPESLNRYEHGAKASLQVARKLEDYFNTKLIRQIDLFDLDKLNSDKSTDKAHLFSDKPEHEALEKMHALGFKMQEFKHAPFKVISNPDDKLIISPEESKIKIKRKAIIMRQAKDALGTHSVIITKEEFSRKNIDGSALVQEEELDSFSRFKELLELIKEREKSKD
ncbi:MAG: helix-turn-helix domain-containing protein [Candidatus Diapherotrites archaeon]